MLLSSSALFLIGSYLRIESCAWSRERFFSSNKLLFSVGYYWLLHISFLLLCSYTKFIKLNDLFGFFTCLPGFHHWLVLSSLWVLIYLKTLVFGVPYRVESYNGKLEFRQVLLPSLSCYQLFSGSVSYSVLVRSQSGLSRLTTISFRRQSG